MKQHGATNNKTIEHISSRDVGFQAEFQAEIWSTKKRFVFKTWLTINILNFQADRFQAECEPRFVRHTNTFKQTHFHSFRNRVSVFTFDRTSKCVIMAPHSPSAPSIPLRSCRSVCVSDIARHGQFTGNVAPDRSEESDWICKRAGLRQHDRPRVGVGTQP